MNFETRFVMISLKSSTAILTAIFSISMCHEAAIAQNSRPATTAVKSTERKVSERLNWMQEKWDGPELKFRDLRINIEGQIKKGVSAESLIKKYDNPQKWMDAQTVFGYAIASYERAGKQNFSSHSLEPLAEPGEKGSRRPSALERLQNLSGLKGAPRTAEYARIRFLWECQYRGYSPLYPVAKRLVTRFPNDFEVKWWAFQSVLFGRGKSYKPDHAVLIRWADDLKKRQPNKPGIGILKPMVYYSLWGYSRTEADEKRAINAFQDFLKTAPANDPQRRNAEMRLRMIPIKKKVWNHQKNKRVS